MGWDAAVWWWIVAGGLVIAELATGTFYLLLLALGAAAAALAAHGGVPMALQFIVAAVFALGAVVLWIRRRQQARDLPPTASSLGLDVGERVRVEHWEPDGSSRVSYRGAAWDARYAGAGTPQPGTFRIRSVDGSRLLLEPATS